MQPQSVQPFQAICGGCAAADTGTAATQPNATSVPSNALADLFRGEAVEEAIASGALQVVLAAAAVGPARRMRRVPRLGRVVVPQALAIVVADHGRPLAALRPVAARTVLAGREGGAVGLGARQDVMHVRRISTPVHGLALFGQRGLLADVVLAVQLGQVVGDDDALGVLPGTFADAVARVDRAGALGAQIGVPGLGAGARGCTKQLAELVRAGDAAEIGALAGAGASDEEADVGLLGVPDACAERRQQDRRENREADLRAHGSSVDGLAAQLGDDPERRPPGLHALDVVEAVPVRLGPVVPRRPGAVRRERDVRKREERVVRGRRLLDHHVEARGGDGAGLERLTAPVLAEARA